MNGPLVSHTCRWFLLPATFVFGCEYCDKSISYTSYVVAASEIISLYGSIKVSNELCEEIWQRQQTEDKKCG